MKQQTIGQQFIQQTIDKCDFQHTWIVFQMLQMYRCKIRRSVDLNCHLVFSALNIVGNWGINNFRKVTHHQMQLKLRAVAKTAQVV